MYRTLKPSSKSFHLFLTSRKTEIYPRCIFSGLDDRIIKPLISILIINTLLVIKYLSQGEQEQTDMALNILCKKDILTEK